jgi:Ca2+-binding RTX toxin-like protein
MNSLTLTAGNDSLNQWPDAQPGTLVGLTGNDTILSGMQADVVYGNEGNDSLYDIGGNNTLRGGLGGAESAKVVVQQRLLPIRERPDANRV